MSIAGPVGIAQDARKQVNVLMNNIVRSIRYDDTTSPPPPAPTCRAAFGNVMGRPVPAALPRSAAGRSGLPRASSRPHGPSPHR